MSQLERLIEIEGGFNIRDLGGYPTKDGRMTRSNRLIRAGNLDQVTSAGQERLLQYGLKTVIDLRHESELRSFPDVFAQSTAVNYLHLPYASNTFDAMPHHVHLGELYIDSLKSCDSNIRAIMIAISDAKPCILYHCAVGKDRTGMISALLLNLAGVPAEAVAEDYAETARHITHLVDQWRQWTMERDGDMRLFERDIAADAASMLATMEALEQNYGGAVGYLRSCGISEDRIARIRSLLLD